MACSVRSPGGSSLCSAWLLNSCPFCAPNPDLIVSLSGFPVPALNLTRASPGTNRSPRVWDFAADAAWAPLPSPDNGGDPKARRESRTVTDSRTLCAQTRDGEDTGWRRPDSIPSPPGWAPRTGRGSNRQRPRSPGGCLAGTIFQPRRVHQSTLRRLSIGAARIQHLVVRSLLRSTRPGDVRNWIPGRPASFTDASDSPSLAANLTAPLLMPIGQADVRNSQDQ